MTNPLHSSHSLGPAGDRRDAGAGDLDQPERHHQVDEGLDLIARAGDLEHEALGRGIDHPGAERVGEPQRLHPVLALAAHLDHGELALEMRARDGHVDHAVHRHQPLELVLDLLDHHGRAARHDGDARQVLGMLGLGDRERVDIVAAPREQADDARQHAGLVVDQHRQSVGLDLLRDRRSRIMRRVHTITLPSSVIASWMLTVASPSSISLCARPDGIMGKQFSFGSTTQSKITGRFTSIISRIAPSRSPGRSQRMPTAW